MDSIAVTKPNMAVLSQKRLFISPFGALAQAFAQELLAQAEQRQGAYPYVPLELLREGEEEAHPQWPAPVLQVDLHLVLQALREQKGTAEQIKSTQRIVERIIEREKQVKQRPARADHSSSERHEPPHQAFYQIVNQNIHLTTTQRVESGGEKGVAPLRAAVPGQLGWQAAAFSRQLQTLAQQERPFGMRQAKERPHLGFLPLERQRERYLPTEVMTHLGAGVGRAEMEESGERSRLNQKLTRAAEQVLDQVLTRTEEPGRAVRQRYDQRQVSEAVGFPADEARNAHQREGAAPAPSGVSGDTRPSVDQAGYREASSGKKGRPSTPRPTEGRGEMGAQPHTSTVAGSDTKRKDMRTTAREIRTGPAASMVADTQPEAGTRPTQGVPQGVGIPSQLTYLAPEGAVSPEGESRPPVSQAQRQERPGVKGSRFPAAGEEQASKRKEIQTTAREIRTGPAVSMAADAQPEGGTRPTQGMPQGVGVPSQLTYLAPEGEVSPEGESHPPVSQAQRQEREPQSKESRFPAVGEEKAPRQKEIQTTAREIRTGPAVSLSADTQPEAGTRPTQGMPQGVGVPSQLTYLAPEGAVFPEGESHPPVSQAQRREREPQSKESRFPAAGEEKAPRQKEIQITAREIRTGPAVSLSADTQPEAGTRPTQGVPQGVGVPSQLTYLAPEGAVSPEGESHPPVSQAQRQEREPQSKESR
ncbi:hypothetical protein, partial [Intestinimonas butyriciproducens]|uniref:hypothetical protein n=1 Tax=Intestinimonas butyriciproducens TaxID=1297617 RepID=UPI00195774BD